VVICLEQGADLHMAELMLLPLTVSCSNKIQIGVCVCLCACVRACVCVCVFAFVDACLVISISAIDCCERNDLLCVKRAVNPCSVTRGLLEVTPCTEQLYLFSWSFVCTFNRIILTLSTHLLLYIIFNISAVA